MSGLDIDTRSDIYSLGVLLYELLAGHPPFDPQQLAKSGMDEIRRTIREVEPARPSTRLAALSGSERTAILQRRGIDAGRLIHQVKGALDWIAMKCLEKDRARRYPSAHALAEDVQRHLSGEPVVAAAPGKLYRLTKFVNRNRRSALTIAALALMFMGISIWQVASVRQRIFEARLVAKLFENGLRTVRTSVNSGKDTTLLLEVLDQMSGHIETELANHSMAQASARLAIGFLYADLREYGKAEAALETARRNYVALFGEKNHGVAAAHLGLAQVSLKQGQYHDAESKARTALEIGTGVFEQSDSVIALSLACLAGSLEAQDKLGDARTTCEKALIIGRKLKKDEPLLLANILETYGKVLIKQNGSADPEPPLREALALRKRILTSTDPGVVELERILLLLFGEMKSEEGSAKRGEL